MTPTLRNYILRNIGPSALRLELVNRLENLCTLTGTPMSPELHRWVEDTFGLDMVRVIEGYSTFSSPVLSPSTLDIVDRVVPKNYQGSDVNIEFRRLFDVSCIAPPSICYWYLDIWAYPDATFINWQIDGQPFYTNVGNLTGNVSQFWNELGFGSVSEVYVWTLDEQANLPAIPNYTDSLGNTYAVSWQQGSCAPFCVQATIPQTDAVFNLLTTGLNMLNANVDTIFTFTSYIDLNGGGNLTLSNFFNSIYNGSNVTQVDDGLGNWIVTIQNVYATNPIAMSSVNSGITYYFNSVPC